MHQRQAEVRQGLPGPQVCSTRAPWAQRVWDLQKPIDCNALTLAKQEVVFWVNMISHKHLLLKIQTTVSIKKNQAKTRKTTKTKPKKQQKKSRKGPNDYSPFQLQNTNI